MWVVPTARGTGNRMSAFWVGIGGIGVSHAHLEQVGTSSNTVKGKAQYRAWYEITPAKPVYTKINGPHQPHAGDVMEGLVAIQGSTVTFDLYDFTRNWSWTPKPVTTSRETDSAEVIAEDPPVNPPHDTTPAPLTNFGTVRFSGVFFNSAKASGEALTSYLIPGNLIALSSFDTRPDGTDGFTATVTKRHVK